MTKNMYGIISFSTFITILMMVWVICGEMILKQIELNIFTGVLFILISGLGSMGLYIPIAMKLKTIFNKLEKEQKKELMK